MAVEFDSRFGDDPVVLPEGVDEAALERLEFVAWVLDEGIRLPVVDYRIGMDPLVGILPVAGDVVTAVASLYIVAAAVRQGVSLLTALRMLGNVAVDVAAGSVPVVGDVFDAAWKANKRNARLAVRDLSTERVPRGPRSRGAPTAA